MTKTRCHPPLHRSSQAAVHFSALMADRRAACMSKKMAAAIFVLAWITPLPPLFFFFFFFFCKTGRGTHASTNLSSTCGGRWKIAAWQITHCLWNFYDVWNRQIVRADAALRGSFSVKSDTYTLYIYVYIHTYIHIFIYPFNICIFIYIFGYMYYI